MTVSFQCQHERENKLVLMHVRLFIHLTNQVFAVRQKLEEVGAKAIIYKLLSSPDRNIVEFSQILYDKLSAASGVSSYVAL